MLPPKSLIALKTTFPDDTLPGRLVTPKLAWLNGVTMLELTL